MSATLNQSSHQKVQALYIHYLIIYFEPARPSRFCTDRIPVECPKRITVYGWWHNRNLHHKQLAGNVLNTSLKLFYLEGLSVKSSSTALASNLRHQEFIATQTYSFSNGKNIIQAQPKDTVHPSLFCILFKTEAPPKCSRCNLRRRHIVYHRGLLQMNILVVQVYTFLMAPGNGMDASQLLLPLWVGQEYPPGTLGSFL